MIYLDHAATTAAYPECNALIAEYNTEHFFNPSSLYGAAADISNTLKRVKKTIAAALGVNTGEILLMSGATEANNFVFMNGCKQPKLSSVILTAGEHASVRACADALCAVGADVIVAPLKPDGRVDVDQLVDAVTDRTSLVSVIHVSNETGAINPIAEIVRRVKQKNPRTLFHSDGVQAFCKVAADMRDIDFYSVSAHKIHGPKGVGALYINKGFSVKPLIRGGGQERGLRSGTENVSGAVAFSCAAQLYRERFDADKLVRLKRMILSGLSQIEGFHYNIEGDAESSPHIVSIRFDNLRGETILHTLEARGILIGLGSACSSHASGNAVLTALGLSKRQAESSVRVSLDVSNNDREIMEFVTACREITAELKQKLR